MTGREPYKVICACGAAVAVYVPERDPIVRLQPRPQTSIATGWGVAELRHAKCGGRFPVDLDKVDQIGEALAAERDQSGQPLTQLPPWDSRRRESANVRLAKLFPVPVHRLR